VIKPDGTSSQVAVQDHAFEYAGEITSIRTSDTSGHTIGITAFGGS